MSSGQRACLAEFSTRYPLLATRYFRVMNLKPATLSKIAEVIPHYPADQSRSATLPLLHLIQEPAVAAGHERRSWAIPVAPAR